MIFCHEGFKYETKSKQLCTLYTLVFVFISQVNTTQDFFIQVMEVN